MGMKGTRQGGVKVEGLGLRGWMVWAEMLGYWVQGFGEGYLARKGLAQ